METRQDINSGSLEKKIEKLNFTKYAPKKEDFCETYTKNHLTIGHCVIQGERPHQEDMLVPAIDEVKGFNTLNEEAQFLALEVTFHEMQQKHGDNKKTGSTGCTAIAWIKNEKDEKYEKQTAHFTTAHLGDSYAYSIILNEDNSVAEVKRLNRLHKPDDEKEKKYIEENTGFISHFGCWRLNRDLAMSRSFGDKKFEDTGINHEPEIEHYEKLLAKGQKAFVVIASDGLELNEQAIGQIINENRQRSPAEIANILVDQTHKKGSEDNISTAVFAVGQTPLSAAIFDGHGGSEVSKKIGEHFYPELQKRIAQVFTPANVKPLKKEIGLQKKILQAEKEKRQQPRKDGLAFLKAARDGNIEEVIQKLKKPGIDINFKNPDGGDTALNTAATANHLDIVEILIKANATGQGGVFHQAVNEGNAEVVKRMQELGVEVNYKDAFDKNNIPLSYKKNYAEILKRLLDKGLEDNDNFYAHYIQSCESKNDEKLMIDNYSNNAQDYCSTHSKNSLNIGLCSILGRPRTDLLWFENPKLSDKLVVAIDEVKNFNQLTPEVQTLTLESAFGEMQKKHGNYYNYDGSTGCAAIAWVEDEKEEQQSVRVTTANLGDSAAYIVILNNDNTMVEVKRLNRLHKPDDEKEKKIIEENGGPVGQRALSRAFGYSEYKNDISHEPEIEYYKNTLSKGQKAFVVVASNGLDKLDEKKIGKIINENSQKSPAEIANKLVDQAYQNESGDNISAAVIPVCCTPLSAAVFDGYGEKELAATIGTQFYPALQETISYVLQDPANIKSLNDEITKTKAEKNAEKEAKRNIIAFIEAAKTGNMEEVTKKLAAGVDINCNDAKKNTALQVASSAGQTAIVRTLLANKADVNCKNIGHNDALFEAYQNNHVDIVEILVEAQPKNMRSILYTAIQDGNADIVEIMLKAGVRIGEDDLSDAYENRDSNVIKKLLKYGAKDKNQFYAYYIKSTEEEAAKALITASGVKTLFNQTPPVDPLQQQPVTSSEQDNKRQPA